MFKPRQYQTDKSIDLIDKLLKYKVAYLSGEVRTGKTIIALMASIGFKGILFITKKKAISSIKKDVALLNMERKVYVINYEAMHQIEKADLDISNIGVVILDEAHGLGQFPKPGKRTKALRDLIKHLPCILLSGTPSPESYSQLYHQFWVTGKGPWTQYKRFYDWAHVYVEITKKHVAMGLEINDYSHTKPIVLQEFHNYNVSLTQEQAGFDGEVKEQIHLVPMPVYLQQAIKLINRDKILNNVGAHNIELTADTSAKLMSFEHQLSSGTAICDEEIPWQLDSYKIDYIREVFKGRKVAIFYCYVAEGNMLKRWFKNWTSDPEVFNKSKDKVFICQVSSGREGINLSTADDLIFYNISYSAVSYWQARARSQTQKGGDKKVHWIFSHIEGKETIEQKIYKIVQSKKNFTLSHFRKPKHNSISKKKQL